MTGESGPDPAAEGRVSTGTSGLDAMLEGGLVPRRPYLIVGPSGTGKTSLALRFLCEGVRRGEPVLLITMEEPPNEIRLNHRGLGTELDRVEVFDAIPDIMRYERVPFKDIASVRHAAPFQEVPLEIRRSPELSAVEVTMTGLEQMLRTEVVRRGYKRLVVDSLTALQYFCMKGFDPVAGAQAFLRFLSDLRVTALLTVESPLEDADTPERMLARGEIRLFRWELEGRTVRAIGVEKFRGSSHDVRLHPYRIGPQGLDINLDVTISRDTRQILEAVPLPEVAAPPTALEPAEARSPPFAPLAEEVADLVSVGAEVGPLRAEVERALDAASQNDLGRARSHLARAEALALGLSEELRDAMKGSAPPGPGAVAAFQRIVQRSEAARTGIPPTELPPARALEIQLEWVLSMIPRTAPEAPAAAPAPLSPPSSGSPLLPATTPEPGGIVSPLGQPPPATHSPSAGGSPVEPPPTPLLPSAVAVENLPPRPREAPTVPSPVEWSAPASPGSQPPEARRGSNESSAAPESPAARPGGHPDSARVSRRPPLPTHPLSPRAPSASGHPSASLNRERSSTSSLPSGQKAVKTPAPPTVPEPAPPPLTEPPRTAPALVESPTVSSLPFEEARPPLSATDARPTFEAGASAGGPTEPAPPSPTPPAAGSRSTEAPAGPAVGPAPKRRRRTSTAPRKRPSASAGTPSPAVASEALVPEGGPLPPATEGGAVSSTPPLTAPEGADATPKPKRRTTRKRKAPTVVRARAGEIPEAEPAPARPSSPPAEVTTGNAPEPSGDPPKEGT